MPRQEKLTSKERVENLRAFVGLCFMIMEDNGHDVTEIALRSGLCISTVYRLRSGGVSLASHYGTIEALGYAAGMRLVETKCRMSIKLAG